jgi:signal transduction histidine kinase
MLLEECSECLSPTRRDYIRRIINSADRMDLLITDALQYSGVVREKFNLEPVDTGVLLRGIVETYLQFQPPRAEIRVADSLPVVLGNQAGLIQCFSNLLSNAVKFVHPDKTPEVRVWAEARLASNGFVRIWFEDKGIGIEKQHQDKIWGMFQKLNQSSQGTGIGLALVSKSVERMGGRVGVESDVGQGSRFWVELRQFSVRPQPSQVQGASN